MFPYTTRHQELSGARQDSFCSLVLHPTAYTIAIQCPENWRDCFSIFLDTFRKKLWGNYLGGKW